MTRQFRNNRSGLAILTLFAAVVSWTSMASTVDAKPVKRTKSAAPATPRAPVWLQTITASDAGGFIIGNPAAATKVIEYASYTCSHCAAFEANDAPTLKAEFVANGKTSFEIRNLVRDPVDLTLAILARCGGKGRFFGTHQFLMANQTTIMSRQSALTEATQQKLETQDFVGFMKGAFQELQLGPLIAQRGITAVQAKACLADPAALALMMKMTDEAIGPLGLDGTPSFLVNGRVAENVADLNGLRPLLLAQ